MTAKNSTNAIGFLFMLAAVGAGGYMARPYVHEVMGYAHVDLSKMPGTQAAKDLWKSTADVVDKYASEPAPATVMKDRCAQLGNDLAQKFSDIGISEPVTHRYKDPTAASPAGTCSVSLDDWVVGAFSDVESFASPAVQEVLTEGLTENLEGNDLGTLNNNMTTIKTIIARPGKTQTLDP